MKNKIYLILGFLALVTTFSCTKLDETLYSEISKDKYVPTEAEIGLSIMPAYAELKKIAGHNDGLNPGDPWELQSHTTDQTLIPTRGGDWYDGGHFQRFFEHTWNAEVPHFNTIWVFYYSLVNTANQLIYDIEKNYPTSKIKDTYIAELRMIKAYGYFGLVDCFGNVPILAKYDSTNAMTSNDADFKAGRKKVFDYTLSEIESCLPLLSSKSDVTRYGRFNTWATYALLAKMYINAESWSGTPMYDECIAACDSIILSNRYKLQPNYLDNFLQHNEGSVENIFVIPYNESIASDQLLTFYLLGWHYAEQAHFATASAPWNGFCAMPSHYKSFDSTDVRRRGWMTGPRFAADGVTKLICNRESKPNQVNYTPEFVNLYDKNYDKELNYKNALEYNGARFNKYEIAKGLKNWCMGNDLAIFRYADILLLKAEALMRKNGGVANGDALALVNQVRKRAGVAAYTADKLTMDELLAERGRELYHEGMRRQDLVRFNKFVRGSWMPAWYDRSGESDNTNVFPIPQKQMNASAGLKQNPGY